MGSGMTNNDQDGHLPVFYHYSGIKGKPGTSRGGGPGCGSTGPRSMKATPPPREWLILLKTPEGKIKYALSNGPAFTTPETFARVSTLRWPLEQFFQEGKSFLGMNHYEHRSLRAWRRHMRYVFLAQFFYPRVRKALQKN